MHAEVQSSADDRASCIASALFPPPASSSSFYPWRSERLYRKVAPPAAIADGLACSGRGSNARFRELHVVCAKISIMLFSASGELRSLANELQNNGQIRKINFGVRDAVRRACRFHCSSRSSVDRSIGDYRFFPRERYLEIA